MEKVDIIKLLKEEKEKQNISQTDFESIAKSKLINNYFGKYLDKKLCELAKDEVIIYNPNSKDSKEIEETNKTKNFVISVITRLVAYQDTNFDELEENELQGIEFFRDLFSFEDEFYANILFNDFNNKRGNDNLNVIETKDLEHKEEIANYICDILGLKANTKAITKFYKNYVVPNFQEAYKQGAIDFDITKNDDRTEKIKSNILTTLNSYIYELSSLGNRNDIEDEDIPIFNFLYIDNEEIKNAMAFHYTNNFIQIYETKEFKEYLNSNKQGCFEIIMRTDDEIIKEKEVFERYNQLEQRVNEVMVCGIVPALNQLNKSGEVIFNIDTPNKKIAKISNNIIVFITKLIISFAENYLQDIEANKNKTVGFMEYLFLENIEENVKYKKMLCQGIMNSFLHYYPSLDFENTDFNEITFLAYSSKENN